MLDAKLTRTAAVRIAGGPSEVVDDVRFGSEADEVLTVTKSRDRCFAEFCTFALNWSLYVDFTHLTRNSCDISKAKIALAFEGSNPVWPAND